VNGRTYPYRHQHKERNKMRRGASKRVRRGWKAVVSYSVSKVQHDVSEPFFGVGVTKKGRTYKTPSHIHVAIETPAASLPNMSVRCAFVSHHETPDKRGRYTKEWRGPVQESCDKAKNGLEARSEECQT
jgi:hypothetical protein